MILRILAAMLLIAGFSAQGTGFAQNALLGDWQFDELAGRWKFDEGQGPIVLDLSGNGNHGVIRGAVRWTEGVSGTALDFDGKTTHVECGPGASLVGLRTAQTVEIWLKPRGTDKLMDVVCQGWGHRMQIWPGGHVYFYEHLPNQFISEAKPSLAKADVWYHVAVVWEGKTAKDNWKIYVDGKLTAKVTNGETPHAQCFPLVVGKSFGSWFFNGSIDDLAIFSRALGPEEIKAHFASKGKWKSPQEMPEKDVLPTLAKEYGKWIAHNFQASAAPNVPGGIHIRGEKIAFTVAVPPTADGSPMRTAAWLIADVDGRTVETLPAQEFSKSNHYSVVVEPKTAALGYYTLKGSFATTSGLVTKEETLLSFGIIPDVALKAPDPGSPFGVDTHYSPSYVSWHEKRELPEIQRKLGIAWFRDGLDWTKAAKTGQVDEKYILAKKYNLCMLPFFEYFDAKQGVLTNGVYVWAEDLRNLKKCLEVHKGLFAAYESQNEPNNFGNWTSQFKGKAPPWFADNWGGPFCDLAKAMKRALNEVDPPAKLLWPDLNAPDHIQKFAEKWGAAEFIDGEAPHPYNMHYKYPEEQEYQSRYPAYLAMLEKNKLPRNIWVTEVGYSSYLNPGFALGRGGMFPPVTETEQAAFLVRTHVLNLSWGIAKTFWYDLYEDGADAGNLEYHFGLLRDGTATPKPAAIAYANLVHQLRNTKYAGKLGGLRQGSYGFAFASSGQHVGAGAGGQYVLVLWTKSENAKETLALKDVRNRLVVTDIYGRESTCPVVDGKLGLDLSFAPLYVSGLEAKQVQALLEMK